MLLGLAPASAPGAAIAYTIDFEALIATQVIACVSAILFFILMSALKILACLFLLVLLLIPYNVTCFREDNTNGSVRCFFTVCFYDTDLYTTYYMYIIISVVTACGCALLDMYKKPVGHGHDACNSLNIYDIFTRIYTVVDVHEYGGIAH